MRSACNEIRFDQFQPVTKKLTWQVATNPIKDLRIKNYLETTSSRARCKIHYGLTILTATVSFRRTSLTLQQRCFRLSVFLLHRRQQSGQFPSMRILPVSAYKGEILVGFRVSLSQEIKFISVYYSGLALFQNILFFTSSPKVLTAITRKSNHLLESN